MIETKLYKLNHDGNRVTVAIEINSDIFERIVQGVVISAAKSQKGRAQFQGRLLRARVVSREPLPSGVNP